MVMRSLILVLLTSSATFGLSVEEWVTQTKQQHKKPVTPHYIAILSHMQPEKTIGVREFDRSTFYSEGFLELVPGEELAFSFLLNRFPLGQKTIQTTFERVSGLTELDLLLITKETDPISWTLAGRSITGELTTFQQKTDSLGEEEEIQQWIAKQLGYNGIVLAEDGDKLLIKALDENVAHDSQGVVFAKSHKSIFLPPKNLGEALITRESSWKNYAIFKFLIPPSNKNSTPRGSKVFLSY
jgi:hypothetical protein